MQKLWQVQRCSRWHQIKEWLETQLRWLQMKKFQHESCVSCLTDWFWYKDLPNPSLYAKVIARTARPSSEQNITPGTRHICGYVWCAAWIISCLERAIWPSRWPLVKTRSTWKLFVSSKCSRFLLDSFQSEVVCHHKKDPQGTASLNRTVLESSDEPIRIWLGSCTWIDVIFL